jgi:transposase|tara:strand:- start:79 stop:1818 length:1740 start_codon:yes stop_codon:yes gene_type:complete
MKRLEAKKINGRIYYYYSEWAWVNGKCRRVWQKYLGKLENIVKAVDGDGPSPLYAEVFQWGLPVALWKECCLAEVVETIDKLCPKRDQGMSTGEYLAIAAVNRAICPNSKRSMWDWFSQTVLLRHIPDVSKAAFSSQRFWDHMDRINADTAPSIWKNIVKGVVKRENIDLSSVSYDGTNFYTFINTFNTRSEIARRGKNKQGRDKLRQISYALFCCADSHMPLFYDVYEGNRNDARQFPLMLQRFHSFLNELCSTPATKRYESDMTLIFDKGNNSAKNFNMLDSMGANFVGSVKLDEHKDLSKVSNNDGAFVSCRSAQLEGTKAFRVTKDLYGRERVLVVSYNQNLFNAQWLTLQNDITRATEKLSSLQQKLKDRANGVIKRGRVPAVESVEKQCMNILKRQYMKRVIKLTVMKGSDNIPSLQYAIDADAVHEIADTHLGKNIIITSRKGWDDEKIILTYRSQFVIEDVFKEMKDRNTGSWWPLHHWTDSKIKVHALYCTIALLLRALIMRRVRQTEIDISLKRILTELDAIREVVNFYPRKRRQKIERKQAVLTKTSEIQQQLMKILELNEKEYSILG